MSSSSVLACILSSYLLYLPVSSTSFFVGSAIPFWCGWSFHISSISTSYLRLFRHSRMSWNSLFYLWRWTKTPTMSRLQMLLGDCSKSCTLQVVCMHMMYQQGNRCCPWWNRFVNLPPYCCIYLGHLRRGSRLRGIYFLRLRPLLACMGMSGSLLLIITPWPAPGQSLWLRHRNLWLRPCSWRSLGIAGLLYVPSSNIGKILS